MLLFFSASFVDTLTCPDIYAIKIVVMQVTPSASHLVPRARRL